MPNPPPIRPTVLLLAAAILAVIAIVAFPVLARPSGSAAVGAVTGR